MLRRQARLRREYVYRKTQENKLRTIQENKQTIKKSLDENRRIPSQLAENAIDIQKTIGWDDEGGEGATTNVDDEYKWAGVEDPKIIVTTARDPSSKLKEFAKEVKLLFPNSQRINRGHYDIKQLIEACRANSVTDLVIISEHRGTPVGLIVCHLPYGPTAYFSLFNVIMRHDIPEVGTMSEAFPHLIFQNFSSKLGNRVQSILKYLFPVPKEDSKRIVTFINDDDFISFRHHVYEKGEGKEIKLKEVGPRMEMKIYQIIQGTIENTATADVEWVHRPYMNTAKKRKFLSDEI
ncbi:U3 small nucleolar ribonucleoprotein protein IMP4 [Patella vulgata]|uniref:U3 small nucleolar ribonucleoprotein protein IMP4 n=1 Tax=Patella vulgata TaxID=6465 RepID=UPI0021801653|nr:U3 small nucleolar ribonucleoprotein protein IMP4 [Patella vulgata]